MKVPCFILVSKTFIFTTCNIDIKRKSSHYMFTINIPISFFPHKFFASGFSLVATSTGSSVTFQTTISDIF